MIVRLCEQPDNSFTHETLLGIICQDITVIIFIREWGGGFYKTGDDCIHRLRYLRFSFFLTKCRYMYISSVSV